MIDPSLLHQWLWSLGAKERQHLSEWVYFGAIPDGASFPPSTPEVSPAVRDLLCRCTGSLEPIEILFHSMDYHYDWIFAALLLASEGKSPRGGDRQSISLTETPWAWEIEGGLRSLKEEQRKEFTHFCSPNHTQQDADWLFLFIQAGETWLLCLECKLVNAWTYGQLAGKLYRLHNLEKRFKSVHFKMALVSPKNLSDQKGYQKEIKLKIEQYLDAVGDAKADLDQTIKQVLGLFHTGPETGSKCIHQEISHPELFQVSRSREKEPPRGIFRKDGTTGERSGTHWGIYRRKEADGK